MLRTFVRLSSLDLHTRQKRAKTKEEPNTE